jgi:sarcosine oxidase subunit alpha
MPRLPGARFAPDCAIEVDGRLVPARAGESVAVALVAAGRPLVARSAKYHRPRGPFCLAGSCHQCLARVDGLPNQRTCRVACRPGLTVESQNALPSARRDVLAAVDAVYRSGLDHHHLLTWNRLANGAAVALSRRLAGLGRLPDAAPSSHPQVVEERFDALVVGGGPAGLGAAEALARAGRRLLLVEGDGALGGHLRCMLALPGDPPLSWAREVAAAVEACSGEVALASTAVGLWVDGGSPVVALATDDARPRLRLVRAPRIVLATGSFAALPLFPRNDLPGVFAGRGVARALAEDGLVPGERVVVLGEGAEAAAIAALLGAGGAHVLTVKEVTAAHGRTRLRRIALPSGEVVRCDALVHAGPRTPASELARAAGAKVAWDAESGGWHVAAGRDGATGVPGLWVAGEVAGARGAAEAAVAGRRAGEAASGLGPA